MTDDQTRHAALEHYHATYDNDAYLGLGKLIAWVFHSNPRAQNKIMNLVIDEAIRMAGMRGNPYYNSKHRKLMAVLRAYPNLKPPVLAYVRRFHRR